MGSHFQFVALHVFGHFVGRVQCIFGAVHRRHFQHDVRLDVIGRYAFAVEKHGAQLELRLRVALQRGFLEVAQGFVEVACGVFTVVEVLAQLVLRLRIPAFGLFLARAQGFGLAFRLGIEGATTHRWD